MIRVLILSDPNNAHTIRWVSSLCKYVDIYVFGLTAPSYDWYNDLNNVQLSYVDFSNKVDNTKDGALNKLSYLKTILKVNSIIKEFQPDIVHGHYASSYGMLASLVKHKKLIQSVWGSDVFLFPKKSVLHKFIFRFNIGRADIIQSSSHIMADEIRLYNNTKPIEIVPFGVDFKRFTQTNCGLEKDADEFVIGTAKSLYPIYGIDYLIKAVALLIKRNSSKKIKLFILGDGQEESVLKALSNELGISKNVFFEGRKDNKEMPKYFNYFDVAVFLSNSESFGVSAIESLACKCPVVVSDAPGFLEVVKRGGIIVPKRNPDAAADALQELLDKPEYRKRLGEEGHSYMKELYSWQKCVEEQVEIYKNLVVK